MKKELLAPNGKPSNLTAEQYKLVRTPEFKKWFGDWENDPKNASKVVDENGEPLVVYHGSRKDFNEFIHGEFGFHFGTEEQAKYIIEESIRLNLKYTLKKFFLNIRKPLNSPDFARWDSYWMAKTYLSRNILNKEEEQEVIRSKSGIGDELLKNILEKKGYNGIFYDNEFEGNGNSFIVWHSNQIKLADGTNTTFDSKSNDIRYNKGGITEIGTPDYLKFLIG